MNLDPAPVRRRLSRRLFTYVLGQYLLPLICCVLAFALLFVILDLFDVLQDMVGAKAPLADVLAYFLLRQPENLVYILPMSVLLAAGYMISNFLRHQELTAIRAAGVSLIAACLPVWIIGALLAVCSFWLSEALAPACSLRAGRLLEEVTEARRGRAPPKTRLAYHNARGSRDWFFESFNQDGRQEGVLIKQFGPDRRVQWELRAMEARYEGGHWSFFRGVRVEYGAADFLPVNEGEAFSERVCDELTETPREILNSLKPAESLTVREMWHMLHRETALPRSTERILWTTLWYRCFYPLSCLAAAIVGIALSISPHGGSRLRGFALAVALLVVYHVVGQVFVLLGKNGMLPPLIAGSVPTLLFAGWGVRDLICKR